MVHDAAGTALAHRAGDHRRQRRAAARGEEYLDFALLYHAAFGLAFEFPVILMFLAMIRGLTSKQMAKHRRHVFMGIALASAVLTPSVDWFTMSALTVAMYLLFETCIWVSRLLRRTGPDPRSRRHTWATSRPSLIPLEVQMGGFRRVSVLFVAVGLVLRPCWSRPGPKKKTVARLTRQARSTSTRT